LQCNNTKNHHKNAASATNKLCTAHRSWVENKKTSEKKGRETSRWWKAWKK